MTDLASGTVHTLGARVAGTDSIHDLAVLQLLPRAGDTTAGAAEGEPGASGAAAAWVPALAPIRLGTSADLRVGQTVYALGCLPSSSSSPQTPALTTTMSVGLVSGLQRSIPSPVGARIYGVLQVGLRGTCRQGRASRLERLRYLMGAHCLVGQILTWPQSNLAPLRHT